MSLLFRKWVRPVCKLVVTRLRNNLSQASDLVSEHSESLEIKWADYFANGFDQYANWPSTRLRNSVLQGSDMVSERSEPLELK